MAVSELARENREYVRRLLKEKQPEFAAMLELAVKELTTACPDIASPASMWAPRMLTIAGVLF